jgi:hypothetical protein
MPAPNWRDAPTGFSPSFGSKTKLDSRSKLFKATSNAPARFWHGECDVNVKDQCVIPVQLTGALAPGQYDG